MSHASVGRFELSGEARAVHQWGALEPPTQFLVQGLETGQVERESDGRFDVALVAVGREFQKIEIRELAQSTSADRRLPHARDDRHAHPQCVERRRVAVVRERVERDVDRVI